MKIKHLITQNTAIQIILLLFIFCSGSFAQAPVKFSYQAVVRNKADSLVKEKNVGIQISIIKGAVDGDIIYMETQVAKTNKNGLLSFEIGGNESINIKGNLANIGWSEGPFFLMMEMDPTGEIDYSVTSINQILSVPYALYAERSGNVDDDDADPQNEIQTLAINGTQISISNGNSISLPVREIDLDSDPTNEIQNLELDGTNLSLSDGNTIDISSLKDGFEANTDNQNLSFINDTLSIDNGNFVVIPDLTDDADADPANELQNLKLNGTDLIISNANSVNLKILQDGFEANTDNQNLTFTNDTLFIDNGNFVLLTDLVNDNDADTLNEIQLLSLITDTIFLENGGFVKLPKVDFDSLLNKPAINTELNVRLGKGAGENTSDSKSMIAIGDSALFNNGIGFPIDGSDNVAIGDKSLYTNTTGRYNTAVGTHSLISNISGGGNSSYGWWSLLSNTIGDYNAGFGMNSLSSNVSGLRNTAHGTNSLYENTTGSENTGIGNRALFQNQTGSFNTAIGSMAGPTNTFPDLTNTTAIGYNAQVTASNTIRLGDGNVTVIEGAVAFTTPSDRRFKTNIHENVHGLDFITQLKPVTYNINMAEMNKFLSNSQNEIHHEKEKIVYTGFIAQDVEKAAQQTGYDFSGVVAPENENSHYKLAYSEFVVPLVKAVQEQQEIIEQQNSKIDELQKLIVEMDQRIRDLEK